MCFPFLMSEPLRDDRTKRRVCAAVGLNPTCHADVLGNAHSQESRRGFAMELLAAGEGRVS